MNESLVRVECSSPDQLRELGRRGLDLHHRAARQVSAQRFVVPAILTPEQIDDLKANGYTVIVEAGLDEVARNRRAEVSTLNRFVDARGVIDFHARSVLGYMTADEVDSALVNLATVHPDLVALIDLPHQTWEQRLCRAVRLSAPSNAPTPRIGVLFTGSMHAREWGGSDILVNLLVRLINAYRAGTGASFGGKAFGATQIRTILENLDVFVFPNVNPDGKAYSQTHDPSLGQSQGFWWRKNRNPNTAVSPANPGVDVNRNFDFLWSSGIGTSSNASSFTYKGVAPESEPESRNVVHLFDTFPNIRYYIDVHSFGGLILYSWGDDNNQEAFFDQSFQNPAFNGVRGVVGDSVYREFIPSIDQRTAIYLAQRMNAALGAARGGSYTVQQAVGLYPTSGTSDDYAYSRHRALPGRARVYGYTIEFGNEFVPPFAEMQNIINEVDAALTEFCWAVNSDMWIQDNPSDTGQVPVAGTFWDSPDVWVRNADDNGTTHQNTIRGQDNFVYVRVRNRGLAEATDAQVRVCIANFAGTEFVHPQDWIPLNPAGGGTISAPGTYLIGQSSIATLTPGSAEVVSVRWPAALIPPDASWHPCLLVEASPLDGPPSSGRQVWENNNLAQKNLTIVDARRGAFIPFPFVVGSRRRHGSQGELIVRRLRAPRSVAVYLDLQDPELLADLLAHRQDGATGLAAAVDQEASFAATLLEPTVIALPSPFAPRGEQSMLLLQLPAYAQVTLTPPQLSPQKAAWHGVMSGFEPVTLGNDHLLLLSAKETGRLRLPPRAFSHRTMALRIAIPRLAHHGDQYLFEVQQCEGLRPLGGLRLQVCIAK